MRHIALWSGKLVVEQNDGREKIVIAVQVGEGDIQRRGYRAGELQGRLVNSAFIAAHPGAA